MYSLKASEPEQNGKEENNAEEDEEKESKVAVSGNGDVDTSEDREIAWETFEYARSIISEYLQQKEHENDYKFIEMLANVHSFLGEICIEDENNENALNEFETALKLQDKCKNGAIKYREKAFNRFYASLAAQFSEKDALAMEHCNAALVELSQGIRDKLALFECEEMKENVGNEELIQFAQECVGKMDPNKRENDANVNELEELIGFMEDLMAKLEELEQGIQWKKDNPSTNTNGDGNTVADGLANASGDPLQALINGLSSRFGIDEAELAKMSAMDSEKDVNGNEKKKKESEGVTTIGFGSNGKVEEDDGEVHELGSFGSKQKKAEEEEEVVNVIKTCSRKRSCSEAGIGADDQNKDAKKMKLNSGDAAVVENKE